MANAKLCCSFCSKPRDQVKKLISGGESMGTRVYICNECIACCNDIMLDDPETVGDVIHRDPRADEGLVNGMLHAMTGGGDQSEITFAEVLPKYQRIAAGYRKAREKGISAVEDVD